MSNYIPQWAGDVTDTGELVLAEHQEAARTAYLRSLKGQRVAETITPWRRLRSPEQNNWLWGVAYPVIAPGIGYEPHELDDLHYGLVAKWGGAHFDKRLGEMVPNKRSSHLTTAEFSDYIEWLVRYAATELGGIYVPLPGE